MTTISGPCAKAAIYKNCQVEQEYKKRTDMKEEGGKNKKEFLLAC
jgi:hypothetical protein